MLVAPRTHRRRMDLGRILYECNDLTFPAGGVRRLYRHVEILYRHGFDAYILHHSEGHKNRWFQSFAPISYWNAKHKFSSEDVLVIPEGHVDIMRSARNLDCRVVVIALNWGNIFRNLRIGESWRDFGIAAIIAGSQYEHDFILSTMGLESSVIVSGIDSDLFAPKEKMDCIVTCMPRKNPDYFHLIVSAFKAKFRHFNTVPFVSIDMRLHEEVAEILAASSVFLAHTFPEGLSRKTLEAMASGNIVVGFAGHGSLECMDHMINCYKAEDGDVLGAAEYLATAIESVKSGSAEPMRLAARSTAAAYSLDREERTVLEFWNRFFSHSV